MPCARQSAGSWGGMALAAVTTRKNASIFPAGMNAISMRPDACADVRPHVRHLARRQQRVAGTQQGPLLPHLHQEVAFDGIEPFILVVMQMARRATFGVERILKDEQTTGILRANLERDPADAKAARFPKSISACRNAQRSAARWPVVWLHSSVTSF